MRTKILSALSILSVLGILTACGPATPTSADITIEGKDGVSYNFNVEIADEMMEQQRGLMERQSMPPDHGMLFIFSENEIVRFWMKNTPIFLDMIFIDNTGTIAHIHHRARPFDETLISSGVPVRAVLEINGGLAKQLGIKEGDKIAPVW